MPLHPQWGPQPILCDEVACLGPFRLEDANVMVHWDADPEMQRWLDFPTELPQGFNHLAHGEGVIRRWWSLWEAGTLAAFMVRDAQSGIPLGSCELRHIQAGEADISYSTIAEHRGRGVATRAVQLLCRWAFDELHLTRIRLETDVENQASRAVARKAGFQQTALLTGRCMVERYEPLRGVRRDMVLYVLEAPRTQG